MKLFVFSKIQKQKKYHRPGDPLNNVLYGNSCIYSQSPSFSVTYRTQRLLTETTTKVSKCNFNIKARNIIDIMKAEKKKRTTAQKLSETSSVEYAMRTSINSISKMEYYRIERESTRGILNILWNLHPLEECVLWCTHRTYTGISR